MRYIREPLINISTIFSIWIQMHSDNECCRWCWLHRRRLGIWRRCSSLLYKSRQKKLANNPRINETKWLNGSKGSKQTNYTVSSDAERLNNKSSIIANKSTKICVYSSITDPTMYALLCGAVLCCWFGWSVCWTQQTSIHTYRTAYCCVDWWKRQKLLKWHKHVDSFRIVRARRL